MEWPQNQSNSTGVFLDITEGRSLYFTPRETLIFGYLFDLADTDDDGLVGANDGGHSLLGRTRLPPSTLQRLWAEAGGESPDECLARPQWFVLLALVALAQAGLPCTLHDLLNTCDVASAQAFQQQRQKQQPHSFSNDSSSGSSSNINAGWLRPIPNFFLDGGVPPSPPPHPVTSPLAPESGSSPTTAASAEAAMPNSVAAGGRKQQQHLRGQGEQCKNVRWRRGTAPPGARVGPRVRVGGWECGGGGDDGAGWGEDGAPRGPGEARGGGVVADGGTSYQLEVTVYSHRVVGEGYGSHTEYTVLTNASLPGFARREMEVARRFSDFRWLHSCFQAIPGVLPPPLPPSKWAGSSSRDFVAERMKGLQRYMSRVAQHPMLSRHYAFQVFLEGTPRGLRAAKALLPARVPGTAGGAGTGGGHDSATAWGDTFSPSMAGAGGTPVSPALSSTPSTTTPDEPAAGKFARRHFSMGGADDMYVPGGGAGGVAATALVGGGGVGGGMGPRQGQRRSVSFGGSSDESSCNGGAGSSHGGGGWTGSGAGWPLSMVANVGYEAYGNYMSTSVSTSLTSIKGVLGAVKTRAKSAVGLGAGPAPIAVEQDPLYEAEVARIEELVAPVAGAVKIMESAAVLKRGVGYEMSRLGHYLTQVASLEDTDGLPPGGGITEDTGSSITGSSRAGLGHVGGTSTVGGGRAAGWAKAEQVLGQRMEKVATAWLGAIDQEESDFLDPLREQLGYLGSAKEVHRGRGRALADLQAANASLQRNKQRLHAARARGDAHMASVSTIKMEAAEERMACAHTRAVLITKTFKGEARRFHECRRAEGVLAILELARAQVLFAHKANAAWKQVLEDINPTDDELRESQQRVRLRRREATIGEAGAGRGTSTAGVIGGWLGAAATMGLSTVTGVAGATASAGLSTVTGVAGAVAARASAAAGASAGGVGKRQEDGGGGGCSVGKNNQFGREGGVAASPAVVSGSGRGTVTVAAATAAAATTDGHGGDGVVGRGAESAAELAYGGAGGVVSRGAVSLLAGAELGVDGGNGGAWRSGKGSNALEVDAQRQQQQHQQMTAATNSASSAATTSSSSFHQPTDDSWELNLEPPPLPREAATATSSNDPASPAAAESRSPVRDLLAAASVEGDDDNEGGDGDGDGRAFLSPLSSRTVVSHHHRRRDGGAPESSPGSRDGIRLSRREAIAAAVAAARGIDRGRSCSNSKRDGGGEEKEHVWAGVERAGVVVSNQLVSLSLDEEATAATAPESPLAEPKGGNLFGSPDRVVEAGEGVASGRGEGIRSLMDSLEALSSSGADSVPEIGGSGDISGGSDGAREGGKSKGDVDGGGSSSSAGASGGGDGGGGGGATTMVVSTSTGGSGSKKKKKKRGVPPVEQQTSSKPVASSPSSSSPKQEQGTTAEAAARGTGKAEKVDSKPKSSQVDGGAVSEDASSHPISVSGSGSGPTSEGLGAAVSAPTTVVRLAGSPNPPLERGAGAAARIGGGNGADIGLRRLAPNSGKGGSSRGRDTR